MVLKIERYFNKLLIIVMCDDVCDLNCYQLKKEAFKSKPIEEYFIDHHIRTPILFLFPIKIDTLLSPRKCHILHTIKW